MTAHSASLISEGETRPRVLRLIPPGQHRHATPSVACAHAGNDAGTGGTRDNGMKAPGPCDPDSTPVQVPGASYRCAAGGPAGRQGGRNPVYARISQVFNRLRACRLTCSFAA